jgi:hypothetical protein
MPQVRERAREAAEKERLNTSIDPDVTVAYGLTRRQKAN